MSVGMITLAYICCILVYWGPGGGGGGKKGQNKSINLPQEKQKF